MNIFKWPSAVCVGLLLFCCNSTPEKVKDFDDDTWKSDRYACKGERSRQIDNLMKQREKFLAFDEMAIVDLLGKPDEQEIYKRNQKFYYYYVEPGPKCTTSKEVAAQRLIIRFNAVGLAKEIDLE